MSDILKGGALAGVLCGLIVALAVFVTRPEPVSVPQQEENLGSLELNRFSDVTQNRVMLNTTSAQVVATSTGRQYLSVCLADPSTKVTTTTISLSPALAHGNGIPLTDDNPCYEIGPDNLYFGGITGIASSSSEVIVVEK